MYLLNVRYEYKYLSYMFENKSTLSKKGKKNLKKESIFSSIAAKGLV